MSPGIFWVNLVRILWMKIARRLGSGRSFELQAILQKNCLPNQVFRFIQVGANDGVSNDFLFSFVRDRRPEGLVIEPLKDLYQELQRTYASLPGVHPVNLAVHQSERLVRLYRPDPARLHELPAWASGIASLDPDHHKKSDTPSRYIIEEAAAAAPLMEIIRNYPLTQPLHLLQIDVEGYDLEVLKGLDFAEVHPLLIRLEYVNLSLPAVDEAVRLMKSRGYYCFFEDMDLTGVDLKQIRL